MLDEWYRREPEGDEVTDCIALLAEEQDRPSSPAAIRAGQALDDQGRLPFEEVDYALEQIGLRARSVFHKSQRWPERDCPAILSAGPGRALILRSTNADGCAIQLPGGEHLIVSHASLAMVTSGEAVAVTPDPVQDRQAERPWDERAKSHWFWQEVCSARKEFRYVMGAALVLNLLAFAMPLFTMNVYDRIIPNRAATSLWVLAAGVIIAIAFEFTLRLARARLIDDIGRSLDAKLSRKLFDKLLNLPLAERSGSTGALARRVTEFEQVRDFFASTTVVLFVDIVFLVLFVALMAVIAGWLALVPVVAIAIMAFAGILLQRSMRPAVLDAQADSSLVQATLVEAIGGLETLKATRGEGRMLSRWSRHATASAQTQERLRSLTASAVNLAAVCQQGTNIALIIGGFYLFNAGAISMGGIIAIVMLAGRSLAPVGQLAFLITRGRQAMLTLGSLQTLMDQPDERALGSRSVVPQIRDGAIEFDGVGFSYPQAGKLSLSDISFKIAPGERIGVIGRVASGKSTLGRVLCGLYPPGEGSYRIDGLDSRQYHPHDLRSAFRFVGQDAELFSGTVHDNLVLGMQRVDEGRLRDAIAQSGAEAFIGRDAAGFDFHIGERGSRLSGGQRSFLVLARALVEPCKLLFLDEPTGSMDTQTEQLFVERLAGALKADQTLIVSTHRNAMLRLIDRLIVIDGGRIVADGPRGEILARGGVSGSASDVMA